MKPSEPKPTGAFVVANGSAVGRWQVLAECAQAIGQRESEDWGALLAAYVRLGDAPVMGLDTEANVCRWLRQVVAAALGRRTWKHEARRSRRGSR